MVEKNSYKHFKRRLVGKEKINKINEGDLLNHHQVLVL
jgi:hypothetical protein